MKKPFKLLFLLSAFFMWLTACTNKASEASPAETISAQAGGGQSNVVDNESQKNVVGVAVSSPDHTTLVAAVKAAQLVDVLSNAGPFTVFAPTNAAFDALPKGTVDDLLKPENLEKLQDILQYHVAVGVYKEDMFTDGQIINMVNLDNVTMSVKDGKISINGANIVAAVPASNGIVYVINSVLLPPN